MINRCVFCDLSGWKSANSGFLEERIIAETGLFYIVASLGQLMDKGGYIIIFPKAHVECAGAMGVKEVNALERLLGASQRILKIEYGTYGVEFEHGIVGQSVKHAHIHIVPGQFTIAGRVENDFPKSKIECIVNLGDLRKLYKKHPRPYLWWHDPEGMRVCWNPPAPKQYLRIVSARALMHPKRADWKNISLESDKKLWSETVRRFRPHFRKLKLKQRT